jgi:hypothetical protein
MVSLFTEGFRNQDQRHECGTSLQWYLEALAYTFVPTTRTAEGIAKDSADFHRQFAVHRRRHDTGYRHKASRTSHALPWPSANHSVWSPSRSSRSALKPYVTCVLLEKLHEGRRRETFHGAHTALPPSFAQPVPTMHAKIESNRQ